jgi:hypothetical protein
MAMLLFVYQSTITIVNFEAISYELETISLSCSRISRLGNQNVSYLFRLKFVVSYRTSVALLCTRSISSVSDGLSIRLSVCFSLSLSLSLFLNSIR